MSQFTTKHFLNSCMVHLLILTPFGVFGCVCFFFPLPIVPNWNHAHVCVAFLATISNIRDIDVMILSLNIFGFYDMFTSGNTGSSRTFLFFHLTYLVYPRFLLIPPSLFSPSLLRLFWVLLALTIVSHLFMIMVMHSLGTNAFHRHLLGRGTTCPIYASCSLTLHLCKNCSFSVT